MDYNSKYTGEQVEDLLDKINGSPEDIAIPTGNYPDMTVGKASQADTATIAINTDNATKAASATTAEYATTAGVAESAEHATTAESATHAGAATKADFATDLSGRVEATPEVFTYRPSAGEKSIKDDNAFIRRVKGNSVVWNQLSQVFPYDNTRSARGVSAITIAGTHYIECSGTTTAIEGDNNIYVDSGITPKINGVSGHKYLFLVEGCRNLQINLYSFISPSKQITNGGTIVICTRNAFIRYSVFIPTSTPVGTTVNEKIRVSYIDLTAMLDAGNEPDTVEEFRALYPDSYYPYNAGKLCNLVCSGIKTVGFNQWDEEWEHGVYKYRSDGLKSDNAEYIRSANFIRVIPANTYCLNIAQGVDAGVGFYDENNNFLGQASFSYSNNSRLFQVPANCKKITFYTKATTYNNDICINLHHTGWRDGEYEPYKEVTHALPLSQITNGEPLRKAGEVYDEINETHYIKRVGVVDLGGLTWIKQDRPNSIITWRFRAKFDGSIQSGALLNMLCDKYITDISPIDEENVDDTIIVYNGYIYIEDTSYTNVAALEQALSGVLLNYELAEPIVTPIETPIDFNYYVEDFGTEEALLAEDSAPFNADIVYQFNATDQIRNNTRNIDKLQKSAFTPRGTSAQYIRGDGSYGNRVELSQSTPINDGEYEMPDEGDYDMQFILSPSYYAKSPRELDDTTTIAVFVTAPEDSNYLAEYWFEFAVGETLPNIEFYQPNNSEAVFRIDGDMMTYAVNILHLISSDGGNTFFGEIKSYSL